MREINDKLKKRKTEEEGKKETEERGFGLNGG